MIRTASRLVLGWALACLRWPRQHSWLNQSKQFRLPWTRPRRPKKPIRAHIVMPVKPGPLTLYYPKWIPGEHGPDGPIANLTGLKFSANGKTIPWERDLLDVFTFHVDVPQRL